MNFELHDYSVIGVDHAYDNCLNNSGFWLQIIRNIHEKKYYERF